MTFVDVLWSLFHLLKGMSVRMEHATASSASSDAVELRMQRHCEMMQDGVAQLLRFLLPSFVKLVFLLMRSAFSLQVSATVVLCHVKLMSGVLSLEVREQMLCSGLCNFAATSIVYLFISFLGSDVNVETRCIVHGSEHPYSYMYAECS